MARAIDPVCGMSVDTERAPAQGVYEGRPLYFCSRGCQEKYAKAHPG